MSTRVLAFLMFVAPMGIFAQEPPPRPVLKALPVEEEIPLDQDPTASPVTPPTIPAAPPVAAKPIQAPTLPQTPPSADGKPTGEDAFRLQIFLDEALFGPGVIDGKPGLFTVLAVKAWNEVNGHQESDWTTVTAAARKAVPSGFAVAVVPEFCVEWVDESLPTSYQGQAKRKRMSYRSVAEFMAERYHTTEDCLVMLNTGKKISSLKPKDSLVVPNVQPFAVEALTGKKYEADPKLSARHVVVDTKMNQARVFEAAPAALVVSEPGVDGAIKISRPNRGLVATFPITPGQPKFIKYGIWELKSCLELPYWRYDKSLLETGKRGSQSLNIPPGPNSPVGILWAGLSKPGIGMHGTGTPDTIGRARSAGCIRLANWDAIRLPNVIRPGASVEIR